MLTLVADRSVEVLGVTAAGLMIAGNDGELRVVASSRDAVRVLERFEVQAEHGPCPECYRSGVPIVNEQLRAVDRRWPEFAPRAVAAGFRSVHALPMRLRGRTIGVLSLFRADQGLLDDDDIRAAQAFADVATIAILSERASAEAQAVNEQLTHALNSRIVIEQAKGMVAQRTGLDMEQSFVRFRAHARNHNLRLAVVARSRIEGDLRAEALDELAPSRSKSWS